eukprot:Nitzschia sp. Nitz4//scaffold47_size129522//86790//88187//NITZ4_003560-RA/size129522-processed-gene-0.48-mRNA-1//-1//CDS//3329552827//5499//frame0
MVNRPPPRPGGSSGGDNDTATPKPKRRSQAAGLEWSLRGMHKIDNSAQHFLTNYYGGDDDDSFVGPPSLGAPNMSSSSRMNGIVEEEEDDQTAYEIFKSENGVPSENEQVNGTKRNSVWDSLHAPLRIGVVDGKRKVFELLTDVTKPPTVSRKERMQRRIQVVRADRSRLEFRIRFWLMQFSLLNITIAYFSLFVLLNVVFGGFFYILEGKCCGDEEFTYADNFAFAVQTSTTIGYGSLSPWSFASDMLVIVLNYISTLMNTLFAGLLFTKFVTPVINVQFSDVITLCNVNGVPCLSIRMGNADARDNRLTDINVRLNYSYEIPYKDHNGKEQMFQQTDELRLLSNRRFGLSEVWTLCHVLDETSPLFGLNFNEHPANKIYVFNLSVDAVQDLTKSSVNIQTEFGIEDIVIGRKFVNLSTFDKETRVATYDYSKLSETEPYPVWYPAKANAYDTSNKAVTREFKP